MKRTKKLSSIEQEQSMYTVSFTLVAICLILVISLLALNLNLENSVVGLSVHDASDLKGEIEPAVSQEEAINALLNAKKDIDEIKNQGFGVVLMNDLLFNAKQNFMGENYTLLMQEIELIENENKKEKLKELLAGLEQYAGNLQDYNSVLNSVEKINEVKQTIYEVNDLIRASELLIDTFEKTNPDFATLLILIENAKEDFKKERYADSKLKLAKIGPAIEEIRTEEIRAQILFAAGKNNLVSFAKENYLLVLILLAGTILLVAGINHRIKIILLTRKIKSKQLEQDVIHELLKKAQTDFYIERTITKHTYQLKMGKYKSKLLKLKRTIPGLKTKLRKRKKLKRII